MSKIETTSKVSLKLTSRINFGRRGACARRALNFGHSQKPPPPLPQPRKNQIAPDRQKLDTPPQKQPTARRRPQHRHPRKISQYPQKTPAPEVPPPNQAAQAPATPINETPTQLPPREYCKIPKRTPFTEHPRVTAPATTIQTKLKTEKFSSGNLETPSYGYHLVVGCISVQKILISLLCLVFKQESFLITW